MQCQARPLISLFRTIVLAAVTALLITSAVLPMSAQDSVPASASQAARMPQFAKRLTPPARRQMPGQHPPQGPVVYDNGPVNGQVDAWTINFGFSVSETMQANNQAVGIQFWLWLEPGDTITSVEVQIGSNGYFSNNLFDNVVNLTQSNCFTNDFGFDVCLISGDFNGPNLTGNDWITLANASTVEGNPVYWDENSGVGCMSPGCPSQAQENTLGTIPSEAFSLEGSCFPAEEKSATEAKAVTVPRSPTQTYRVIYNFTGGVDGGAPSTGLVVDAAGNLYGTTSFGGPFGDGTAFKLTPGASGWRFYRLYAFSGANGSSPDSTLVLDPDGRLYGTTSGGGVGDGVLFGLSPAGNILPSVFSNWMETLLYRFTGGSDGADPGGSLVLDSSGNIYGNAARGGAHNNGTLYEFTNGGLQVLHAFPGFLNDGLNPAGVVSGSNGLYGITKLGGTYDSGTLYTTAGGYQVLHNFMSGGPEGNPTSLAADQAGNLYGTDNYSYFACTAGGYNQIFGTAVFQASAPDWNPSILQDISQINVPLSYQVSTDALGNVYGTTNGYYFSENVFELTCCWNYTDLHDFTGPPNDGANPEAAPVVDAQGNIYGTTSSGGTYGYGVVWEISP